MAEMIQDWFGYSIPDFPGDAGSSILGAIGFFHGGWPFLTGALDEVRPWRPGMILFISLAITVAFVASAVRLVTGLDFELWWELATEPSASG